MIVCIDEVCKRRGLKVNADKSKVMVLGGEEGSVNEISMGILELNIWVCVK